MIHPYTLGIICNENGDVKSATTGSNVYKGGRFSSVPIDLLPPYVHERIALLRLTDNKEGGLIFSKVYEVILSL